MPEPERIAVFDNDGTRRAGGRVRAGRFMLDQLRAAAPKRPEWKNDAAFNALVAHNKKALAEIGREPVLELLAVANSGMRRRRVRPIDPRLAEEPQPSAAQAPVHGSRLRAMQGLLAYLRANGSGPSWSRAAQSNSCGPGRRGVRHSSGTDRGQPAGCELRDGRGRAGADARTEDRLRQRARQADGRLWQISRRPIAASAIPTAICRCCRSLRRARAGA